LSTRLRHPCHRNGDLGGAQLRYAERDLVTHARWETRLTSTAGDISRNRPPQLKDNVFTPVPRRKANATQLILSRAGQLPVVSSLMQEWLRERPRAFPVAHTRNNSLIERKQALVQRLDRSAALRSASRC
jgi:hypothetical protein